ncbi:MAG: cold-shock protein [Flavisolibacter sp.]
MAKSKETFNKREKEKRRQKQKQEKREKMEERKANASKKSLDDMMAYVDEDGNITNTPPDPRKKKEINAEDIVIGVNHAASAEEDVNEGRVDYYNDEKGFGFIISPRGEKFFFHVNNVLEQIRENDKVTFDVEKGPKGWNAVAVRKLP